MKNPAVGVKYKYVTTYYFRKELYFQNKEGYELKLYLHNETQKYWEYWNTYISFLEKDSPKRAINYAKEAARQLSVPESLVRRIFKVNLSSYSVKIDSYYGSVYTTGKG